MAYYKDYDEDDIYEEPTDDISDEDLDEYVKTLVEYKHDQEHTLIVDLKKCRQAYKVYHQLTELMNAYDAEYTITVDEYNPLSPKNMTYVIVTDIFGAVTSKIGLFRGIIAGIDKINIYPRTDDKICVNITINDFYIDAEETNV